MADYERCGCDRGSYNPYYYQSCYECYQERAEGMVSCIFCGRWHSDEYSTCYRCRTKLQRDEAGQNIRTYIEWRDEYRCRNCGATSTINIDHIKPCKSGGGAALWNLQVLCNGCNRVKGASWLPGGGWDQIRRGLNAYYTTTGRPWLDATQLEYARADREARQPVNHLDIWDRWLHHSTHLVLTEIPVEPVADPVFYCPQCGTPAPAFYGDTTPVCIDCWNVNEVA